MKSLVLVATMAMSWMLTAAHSFGRDIRLPDLTVIMDLERRIVMPQGALPLERYDRHYAYRTVDDRQLIVGEFVRRGMIATRTNAQAVKGVPNVFVTSLRGLPMINDGGCSVVTVADVVQPEAPRTSKVLGVCNGRA